MRHLLTAVVLALLLSGRALAGEIPSGDFVPPPPTETTTSSMDAKVITTTDPADPDYSELSLESLETMMLTIVGMMFR